MLTHKFFHLSVALVAAMILVSLTVSVQAALVEGTHRSEVLIGRDDDNVNNTEIQPPGTVANQSLNNADALDGKGGNDVLIGLLGSDTMLGGLGTDILIGGTEQGTQPNSDIMFGNEGNDINIWAGGDGSDAFIGGANRDALVMGTIDRDANNVPILTPVSKGPHRRTGLPTADVSGQGGFCTLERVEEPDLGFDFLVRFFARATGNLLVTIRVIDVEQVFCTSEAGGAITFADLRDDNPEFVEVSLEEVEEINRTVARIIR